MQIFQYIKNNEAYCIGQKIHNIQKFLKPCQNNFIQALQSRNTFNINGIFFVVFMFP